MGMWQDSVLRDEFWKKSTKRFTGSSGSKVILGSGNITIQNRLSRPDYINATKSNAPQVVIKIISSGVGSTQLIRMLNYITRESKEEKQHLELQTDNDKSLKDKEERYKEIITDWKQDFESKEKYKNQKWKLDKIEELEQKREALERKFVTKGLTEKEESELQSFEHQIENKYCISKIKNKETDKWEDKKVDLKVRGINDFTHILLSVGGKPNEKDANKATQKFLEDNLKANGFKYTYVKHNDTDNLHYHLVIKGKNKFGQKLHFDKADLFILRQEYSRYLSEMGIKRVSTLRMDRTDVLQKVKEGVEDLKQKDTWFKNQMKKTELKTDKDLEEDRNFNIFAFRGSQIKKVDFLGKYIKGQLKKNSGVSKFDLKDDLEYLKNFKTEINKKLGNKEEIFLIVEKTLKSLTKDNQIILKKLDHLQKPLKKQEKVEDIYFAKEDTKRKQYIKIVFKRHLEELKNAKEQLITTMPAKTEEDKKRFREIIGQVDSMLKFSKDKGKDRRI